MATTIDILGYINIIYNKDFLGAYYDDEFTIFITTLFRLCMNYCNIKYIFYFVSDAKSDVSKYCKFNLVFTIDVILSFFNRIK